MNDNIDEEIREIVEETTKWHKLFESFWKVSYLYKSYIISHKTSYYVINVGIFKTLESFKSKYIIERQNSLLKKLQAENNIVKNENSQLKLNNGRLVARLRARYSLFLKKRFFCFNDGDTLKIRLAPRMSPGGAISGTCLRDDDDPVAETPLSPTGIFSPPKPINSPIFPNLVQANLDKETEQGTVW